MQEIALFLSSLAGVATAAAVRKMPREKNQLLSLGASSHIKSQINSLKIEKDILTKTISRLYQAESEFSKIQKDKLLLKYQHQLGIILAKLEKLEQASKHPDLGPVGDGLITLMDQKLSKLDERLYEISSRMATANVETPEKEQVKKQEPKRKSKPFADTFHVEKPKETINEPIEIPATKSRQSFELTTLTSIPKNESKFPLFEDGEKDVTSPTPQAETGQTGLFKPEEQTVKGIIQPRDKVEGKIEIIQQAVIGTEPKIETRPDIEKEVARVTKHKALPEPEEPRTLDENYDDDGDDLDEIKAGIKKVLDKLDQAEVE